MQWSQPYMGDSIAPVCAKDLIGLLLSISMLKQPSNQDRPLRRILVHRGISINLSSVRQVRIYTKWTTIVFFFYSVCKP